MTKYLSHSDSTGTPVTLPDALNDRLIAIETGLSRLQCSFDLIFADHGDHSFIADPCPPEKPGDLRRAAASLELTKVKGKVPSAQPIDIDNGSKTPLVYKLNGSKGSQVEIVLSSSATSRGFISFVTSCGQRGNVVKVKTDSQTEEITVDAVGITAGRTSIVAAVPTMTSVGNLTTQFNVKP